MNTKNRKKEHTAFVMLDQFGLELEILDKESKKNFDTWMTKKNAYLLQWYGGKYGGSSGYTLQCCLTKPEVIKVINSWLLDPCDFLLTVWHRDDKPKQIKITNFVLR